MTKVSIISLTFINGSDSHCMDFLCFAIQRFSQRDAACSRIDDEVTTWVRLTID